MENFYVFKTYQNYYVYDASCNKFTKISEDLYKRMNSKKNGDISDIYSLDEVKRLKERGFFHNDLEIVEHPATEALPHLVDRQMQTMVLQVTQGCNLRCHYCPYSQDNHITRQHNSKIMSWETAKKAIDILCEHSMDSEFVTLNFYGGEPLLNIDLIKKSVIYIKENLYGKDLHFALTTNATLMTDDIMKFFNENDFSITISLDGDKTSNDINRQFAYQPTESVFDVVMEKLCLMKDKYENLYNKLGLNMVLDPSIDFMEYDNLLIKYPFLKDISIDVVIKEDTYLNEKNIWIDSFTEKYTYRIFQGYLRALYGFKFKSDLQYFANNHKIFDEDVYPAQAGEPNISAEKITPLAMCLLGHDKVFVTADGEFYPCEKVNETSKIIKLGDITTGFDYDKLKQVLNLHKYFQNRCKSCIAIRECSMCLNSFGATGIEDNTLTSEICKANRVAFCETLRKRAIINEAKEIIESINVEGGHYE